jgi:hypothetical protein
MPVLKRIIARLIGFDGSYHRFTGKVTIEKFEGEARTEIFEDRAIWELMYFGEARPQGADIRDCCNLANAKMSSPAGAEAGFERLPAPLGTSQNLFPGRAGARETICAPRRRTC